MASRIDSIPKDLVRVEFAYDVQPDNVQAMLKAVTLLRHESTWIDNAYLYHGTERPTIVVSIGVHSALTVESLHVMNEILRGIIERAGNIILG